MAKIRLMGQDVSFKQRNTTGIKVTFRAPQDDSKKITIRDSSNSIKYNEARKSPGLFFGFIGDIVSAIDANKAGVIDEKNPFYNGDCNRIVVEDLAPTNSIETVEFIESEACHH